LAATFLGAAFGVAVTFGAGVTFGAAVTFGAGAALTTVVALGAAFLGAGVSFAFVTVTLLLVAMMQYPLLN
jgi:hypothetical protein